ncbi:MAG: ATP-binding protein, partial [Vicinamibacterales bacterium]
PASFREVVGASAGDAWLGDAVLRGESASCADIAGADHWPTSWREVCLAHDIRACHVEPACSADGGTVGSFVLCFDDARSANPWELRLASFGAHIASIVIERSRAEQTLLESEERLLDADRRKDEFLAMLAHELRNPLAPIRTGLELVRLAGDTPGAVERIRPMMERQVGHMVRLIDDLLDVSRITSGKVHLQMQPALLSTLVDGAVEANRAIIDAAGIDLTVALPEAPTPVLVDPTRFVQVLSNLLNNAAKFTPAGGRIAVRGQVAHGATDGAVLILAVEDNGVGISREMLPRVFDLFMQGERPAKPQAGLGIGLALARRIVEMHGGTLEGHSDGPGRGSEFTIRIPLLETVSGPSPDVPQPVERQSVEARVLIVDDNTDAAETLAALVSTLGGDVRTAADGQSGIDCASLFAPDLIFLDIGMATMDGYETCRRIRQEPFGQRASIVALTGWGQERDKHRAADAGFDAHLTKPVDPIVVERLLAETTRARRRRAESE